MFTAITWNVFLLNQAKVSDPLRKFITIIFFTNVYSAHADNVFLH